MAKNHEQLNSNIEREVMKVPEVEYQNIRGVALNHILQKVTAGGEDCYADVIENYQDISADFDDESLRWISLAYDNPEVTDQVIANIKQHKGKEDVSIEQISYYLNLLKKLEEQLIETEDYSDHLDESDVNQEYQTELEDKVRSTVDFFRPYAETTPERKVVVVPTSRELIGESGWAFASGDVAYVVSPIDKVDNQVHEYAHTVINPIVEKMDISEDEKRRVIELASSRLVEDEGYGEHAQSLLDETLIRVYCKRILGGVDGYFSLDELKEVVDRLSDERFVEIIADEKFKKRMQGLGVKTLGEYKGKIEEYYNLYEKDDLAQRIIAFYEEYQNARSENPDVVFEDYYLANWRNIIE